MLPELTEKFIQERLQQAYRPEELAAGDREAEFFANVRLKCAAVLLPLAWWQEGWNLVFTRRTETVEHHKGQVSFPGGGCEVHETSPEEVTALITGAKEAA